MSELLKFLGNDNFKTVTEKVSKLNIKIKQYKNLYMLYFDDNADFNNPIVRQANGIILEKNTNKLIHYSFEKTYQGFEKNSITKDPFKEELKNFSIEPYFEGSLIKLYYYENEWKIGTSRHLLASKTKWTSKNSFDNLFKEALELCFNCTYEDFLETLNSSKCYTFLLQHPENKLISNVALPMVFQVNEVDIEKLVETRPENKNFELSTNNLNFNHMIYLKNENNVITRIKVLTDDFTKKLELRGNNPRLEISYMKNTIENPFLKQEYLKHFPEYKSVFEKVDKLVYDAIKNIHFLYIQNYIEKKGIEVIDNYKRTLAQLHGQYKKTRKQITEQDVYEKINSLDENIQSYIINV